MSKRIFVFNDGTGQGPKSKSLSNVEKIFRVLPGSLQSSGLRCDLYKVDEALSYHSLYFRGIGIADDRRAVVEGSSGSRLHNFFHGIALEIGAELQSLVEEVAGVDIKDRVEGMLADIKSLWEPGDKIYFVGFSRGASGVRIAASLIKKMVPEVEIDYLLVFDTVYSVMGPIKILDFDPITFFSDQNIGTHIRRCDHLISGDETREKFPLTPVEVRNGVRQIMFAGSHSDVGGGADKSCLSDISLSFAFDQLQALGVQIPEANIDSLKLDPNCESPVGWDLFNGTGQRHFPRDFRKISFLVHESVGQRCSRQGATPIALAQLATFKLGEGELVSLDKVTCTFAFGAPMTAPRAKEQMSSTEAVLSP